MPNHPFLPPLPEDFEPTRATLHAYAHAVGALPRAHAVAHPKWWHISLGVEPVGLVTDTMATPAPGSFRVRMDLRTHDVRVEDSDGGSLAIPMNDGITATEMGDRLIEAAAGLGLDGEYAREKFESDDPRPYDAAVANVFFDALVDIERAFARHRGRLVEAGGDVGPIQLWPHGFDLAFEWFGTRTEEYEGAQLPSQLNLGFSPGGRPYFYSNPWPFERDQLLGKPLPHGAEWHTEGWEGSILYYDQLAGDPDAERKLLEYAWAVYELAAPTLTA